MLTPLALLRLPSWKALSSVERQFVWRNCVHSRLARSPVAHIKFVLVSLVIIISYHFGAIGSLLPSLITMLAIVFGIPELVDLFLVAQKRRNIAAYIQSHGPEIATAV